MAQRAAIITDIHGNLAALEAVLAAIEDRGVERTFRGGDLVGYGPSPTEVCALIERRDIPSATGLPHEYGDQPLAASHSTGDFRHRRCPRH